MMTRRVINTQVRRSGQFAAGTSAMTLQIFGALMPGRRTFPQAPTESWRPLSQASSADGAAILQRPRTPG
jgi:hypothetical protein